MWWRWVLLVSVFAAATATNAAAAENELLALLHDWKLIQSNCLNDEAPAGVLVAFDDGKFKRRDKAAKDRYEALYHYTASLQGTQRPAATIAQEFIQPAHLELWHQLHDKFRINYVATKANWKYYIREGALKLSRPFREYADELQRQHQDLLQTKLTSSSDDDDDSHSNAINNILQTNLFDSFAMKTEERDIVNDCGYRSLQTKLHLLFNATYLPTHEDLYLVFPWLSPVEPSPVLDLSIWDEDISLDNQITHLTPLDWVYYFSNHYRKLCEIWNVEYIAALSAYIAQRVTILFNQNPERHAKTKELIVLEIGAGDGRLTHFLNTQVHAHLHSSISQLVKFIATDIGGNKGDIWRTYPVEKLSFKKALKRYKPTIVLCSWMSLGVDWTEFFRQTATIDEYILIGEVDYGVSGVPLQTWGIGSSEALKGFERVDLDALAVLQIARSDHPHVRFHSSTTSFRRIITS